MKKVFNLLIFALAGLFIGCEKEIKENESLDPAISVSSKNEASQNYYLYRIQTCSSVRAFNRNGELTKSEVKQLYSDFSDEASFQRTIQLQSYSEYFTDTLTQIRIYSNDSVYFRSPFALSGPIWEDYPSQIYRLEIEGNRLTFTSRDTLEMLGVDEHSATTKMARLIRKYPFAYLQVHGAGDGYDFQERFYAEKCEDGLKFQILKYAYIYLVYEVDQGFWFNRFKGSISSNDIPVDDAVLVQEWEHIYKKKKD